MRGARRLITVCLVGGLSACSPAEPPRETRPTGSVPWGYGQTDGPDVWGRLSVDYDLCATGTRQSPIDLTAARRQILPSPTFDYESSGIELLNTGHTIEMRYDAGSWLGLQQERYALEELHFRVPSEHTIDGRSFPMELHLLHRAASGGRANLALLVEAGARHDALAAILDNLPEGTELPRQVLDARFTASDLLPAETAWYRYDGSLTEPPCAEGVRWLIAATPIQVDEAQLEQIRAVVRGNNRPIQPTNGRPLLIDASS